MDTPTLSEKNRKAKRIARNKIAKDIMLIITKADADNCATYTDINEYAKRLAKEAITLANAFVDEIENNPI